MHYDTDIYRAVEHLGDLVVCAARRMPRDLKPVLGARLVDEAGHMAILVREAAIARGAAKVPIYEELIAGVDLTQFFLLRAFNNKGLGPKLYSRCLPVAVSIGKQANKLRRKFASAP